MRKRMSIKRIISYICVLSMVCSVNLTALAAEDVAVSDAIGEEIVEGAAAEEGEEAPAEVPSTEVSGEDEADEESTEEILLETIEELTEEITVDETGEKPTDEVPAEDPVESIDAAPVEDTGEQPAEMVPATTVVEPVKVTSEEIVEEQVAENVLINEKTEVVTTETPGEETPGEETPGEPAKEQVERIALTDDVIEIKHEEELVIMIDPETGEECAVLPAAVLATASSGTQGAQGFVERMYQVVLNRKSDPAGLKDWTNQLLSGEKKASDIVLGFFGSSEYQNKKKNSTDMVTDFYKAMLDRNPDQAGFEDWKSKIDAGMTYYTLAGGFVGSQEFMKLCNTYQIENGTVNSPFNRDKNYERTAFVGRLYKECLNRSYDQDGLEYWCTFAENGGTAGNMAAGFIFSKEFKDKHLSNEAYVDMLYKTFLGRLPDMAGMEDWETQLNYTRTREAVFNGFLYSPEFGQKAAKAALLVGDPIATPDNTTEWKYNIEVLRLCNEERTSRGLNKLTTRQDLWEGVAMIRARECSVHFVSTHARPDGREWYTAYNEAGISFSGAAENIAEGYRSPSAVVNGWMNSTGHRANILGSNTILATGVYFDNRLYWSQNFLIPRPVYNWGFG